MLHAEASHFKISICIPSSILENFDISKLSFTRLHASLRRDRSCSLIYHSLLFLRRKRATTGASYLGDTRRCTRRPNSRIFNGAWREASAGANKFAVSLSSVKMYLRFLSISRIPPGTFSYKTAKRTFIVMLGGM